MREQMTSAGFQVPARPRLLTAKQAAERVGMKDPETIKAWAREAGYHMPRLGRGRYTLLFPEELIDELIARRTPQIPRIKPGFGIRSSGFGEKEFQI